MIRAATPADAEAIAAIHERALAWAEEVPQPLPQGETLVAEIGGQVYGFVTTDDEGAAVFVDPRAQGAGLEDELAAAARAR
jgi:ribosomal protein S18 acetylase RimI-like enzyme